MLVAILAAASSPTRADGLLCQASRIVGMADTAGSAREIAIAGATACVADQASGLHIFDVSDPAAPVLLGSCDTDGAAAEHVVVVGTTAYLLFDVTDPASPALLGRTPKLPWVSR